MLNSAFVAMDLYSHKRSCRLCLETSDDDLINVFESFQNSTIAAILSKYFWFDVLQNDGMPEWLCQICWIQTKTFHNFFKRIEFRHGNYKRPTDNQFRADGIKQEINSSPVDKTEESAYIVKHEEMEDFHYLGDLITCNDGNSDFEDTIQNEDSENSDNEERPSGTKTNNDSDGNIDNKNYKLLREEQDIQIRDFFNMKCEICSDVEFETLLNAKQHYRKLHETEGYISCCGKKFKFRREIMKHIRHHIDPDAFRCDQCNKSFKEEKSLKNHIDNHAPLDSREFKCTLCRSSFTKAISLKVHMENQHTNTDGKFPCEKCDKNFRSKRLLSCHNRQIHEMIQEYVCEVCARPFKNKQNLQSHVKFEHSTTPPPKVQCNICGALLKHKVGLRHHLAKQHTDSTPINCQICNKEVRNADALRSHVSYVHGEKRYPCTLCEKTFRCGINLKEHVATHTGEDLYRCAYCEKKFKSSANMMKHRRMVHLAEWTRDRPQSVTSTKVSEKNEVGSESIKS